MGQQPRKVADRGNCRRGAERKFQVAKTRFFFVTYGTSEFYTKPYRSGAASPVTHIGLDQIAALVEAAQQVLAPCKRREEWLRLMQAEQTKREHAARLLADFQRFRKAFLRVHDKKENDFPRTLACSAPELAFPIFARLNEARNESHWKNCFGRLAIYPVPRAYSRVHDSILNFRKMRGWARGFPSLNGCYLEINEDFNLNVKTENAHKRKRAREALESLPAELGTGHKREYKQSTWVIYELDFGLLDHIRDLESAAHRLGTAVEAIVRRLETLDED